MNQTDPTALWQHLVQWQPATAAALAQHIRALPDDWPLRVFGVGRPDAALTLPPGANGEQFPDRTPEVAPYDEIAPLDDCPACTEVGGTCRWHEGYAAGHHEAVQAQLDARKANPTISLREFMRWQSDVEEAEDRGEEPPALPAAASAVVSPPTNRAAVLAEAIRRVEDPVERAKTTTGLGLGWEAARDVLRRLAVEAHDTGTQQQEAHPAEHSWAAELYDPAADEWVPGSRYLVRDRAVNALEHGRRIGPTWKDGTPTQRRLVRATTTYTVEEPAPVAQQHAAEEEGELVCVDQCGSCDACGMEPFGTPAEGWREAARFLRRTPRDSVDFPGALRGARLIEDELRRRAEQQAAAADGEETPFVPPMHYRGRDGTTYCVHATPIGPNSCRECRDLADN